MRNLRPGGIVVSHVRSAVFILCLIAIPSVIIAEAHQAVSVRLNKGDIVAMISGEPVTKEAFVADWGQFPIPAPNCLKNIILRMPAVAPDDPARTEKLSVQWALFQRVLAVKRAGRTSVNLALAREPYLKDRSGHLQLEYCNAYISSAPGR